MTSPLDPRSEHRSFLHSYPRLAAAAGSVVDSGRIFNWDGITSQSCHIHVLSSNLLIQPPSSLPPPSFHHPPLPSLPPSYHHFTTASHPHHYLTTASRPHHNHSTPTNPRNTFLCNEPMKAAAEFDRVALALQAAAYLSFACLPRRM
jgi:hypothetical protein